MSNLDDMYSVHTAISHIPSTIDVILSACARLRIGQWDRHWAGGGADCGRANRPGGARTDSLVSLNWQANAPRRELSAVLSMSGAPRRSWRPGAVRDPQSALSRLSTAVCIYREPLFEVWPSKRIELLLSVTLSSLPSRTVTLSPLAPSRPNRDAFSTSLSSASQKRDADCARTENRDAFFIWEALRKAA